MTLDTLVFDAFRLKLPQKKALEKLGIRTIGELLYYFPTRHQESAGVQTVASLTKGDYVLLTGKLSHIKTARAFRTMAFGIPMAHLGLATRRLLISVPSDQRRDE